MTERRRSNGKRDRLERAYQRGGADRHACCGPDQNPFVVAEHRSAWQRGWDDALPRPPLTVERIMADMREMGIFERAERRMAESEERARRIFSSPMLKNGK